MKPLTVARFWSKVDVAPTATPCCVWRGAMSNTGYGNFLKGDGVFVSAHRVAYELLIGDIPDGLDIDHLCRNRACVNPWHMEPVTRRENLMRGESPAIRAHILGICKRGHVIDGVRKSGKRYCKTCSRDLQRQRRAA